MRDKSFNKLVELFETMNPAMGEAPARTAVPASGGAAPGGDRAAAAQQYRASVQAYASKINDIFKAIKALSNDPNFEKLYRQVRNKNQLNTTNYERYIGDFYGNLAEYSYHGRE
jgi:hypothetical protein